MKKALGIIPFSLLLIACGQGNAEDQELSIVIEENGVETVEDFAEVALVAEDNEATIAQGDTLSLVLENNTTEPIAMGQEYYVQEQVDEDNWESLDLPQSFTLDLIEIEPEDQHDFDVVLIPEVSEDKEVELPVYDSGTYRINKFFTVEINGSPRAFDVSIEFEVE